MTHHDSQTWERLFWTSGGLLNLTKCAFYILAWTFDDEGRASYVPKAAIPDLHLTSGDATGSEKVSQLNFDEHHAYLGNKLSTNMQMKSAETALQKTATAFASRIMCSNLTRHDAWVAYFAVFVPSMIYTLPVLHHLPKRLRKLQSAATRATLMKIGFNRNTAHRVVYGPSRYGGLGFRDLVVEQGIAQIEMLVRHLRANSPQGELMRIIIAWWQLVVGVSFPLLENTATTIPHLGTHWLATL
jgi:hypothetical protein